MRRSAASSSTRMAACYRCLCHRLLKGVRQGLAGLWVGFNVDLPNGFVAGLPPFKLITCWVDPLGVSPAVLFRETKHFNYDRCSLVELLLLGSKCDIDQTRTRCLDKFLNGVVAVVVRIRTLEAYV